MQLHRQLQQQQDNSGLLLQAFLAAAPRQLPGAEIVGSYMIPHSPVILPVAVLPAAGLLDRLSASRQQGQQSAIASDDALEHVQQEQQQQQQDAGLVTATIGSLQQLRKGHLQFEPEVLVRLRDWQQQGLPIAVFEAGTGPSGLQQRWFTSSQPQQLLPLAQQWEHGLVCAGWRVLLLQLQQVEEADAAE
jgi:hypothetical protein